MRVISYCHSWYYGPAVVHHILLVFKLIAVSIYNLDPSQQVNIISVYEVDGGHVCQHSHQDGVAQGPDMIDIFIPVQRREFPEG